MNNQIQHVKTLEFLDSFDSKSQLELGTVVDSGCGDGFASNEFVKRGARWVLAYDPQIDKYNDKYFLYYPERILRQDTAPFSPVAADIVWSHHVIEHQENPIEYLMILGSMLKDTGELWLSCPNTANIAVFAYGHLQHFTIGNLILCLQRAKYATYSIKWWVAKGQLRIRIPLLGDGSLPEPFVYELKHHGQHFDLTNLPEKWNWK